MELLPNWSLTYDPTVYTTGHRSLGLLARYRVDLAQIRTRLIGGVDVDYSPGFREELSIAPSRAGSVFASYTRGERIYDYDVTFRGVSPYLHAEVSPAERLNLTAGLRYDAIGYAYDTRLDAVQTGKYRRPGDTDVSYSHLSPKLGATYELGPALSVFASYGHGFRAPSEGQLFRQGQAENTIDLKPVEANSYEAGARGNVSGRLGWQVSAYRMPVKNDILTRVNADGTRETANAGRTLHRGIEVGVGAALPAGFRADVTYSRARHTYEEWGDPSGNEIENAPRTMAGARLEWAPRFAEGGKAAVEWQKVGGYWMDAANRHRYDGHHLLNLRASVPVTEQLEVTGRVNNLTDRRYAESVGVTGPASALREEFAPGLPRTVFLGLQLRVGGR